MGIKEETVKGAFWSFLQKVALQPAQFIFGIILARLITPEEMGILGLTGIFFAFATQLQDAGFGAALIRKQDRSEEDINTVFWFNVGMSFLLSTCLFLAAPWFASFFNQPALLNLTRVSALMMFLQSTGSVHWTLYAARRDFKTPSIITIITTLIPMPFTIWAAYAGWSYWAPMVQGVLSGLLGLCIIWCVSPWKPRFLFSGASFRSFFGFSSRLALTGLVWTIYDNLRTFIIGKFYSAADLALFTRGEATTRFPIRIIMLTLGGVTYPILATIQDDPERLIRVYRQYIRMTFLFVAWGMLTITANAHDLILAMYGENWGACSLYVQLFCIGVMFGPLAHINVNLCTVLGRTDITLRREVILRCFSIPVIIIGACHSVLGVCLATILTSWLAFILSVYLTSRISTLTVRQQLADASPYVLMSLIANIPAFMISQLGWHPWASLMAGGSSSLGLYLLMLLVRRDTACTQLYSYFKETLQAKYPALRRS